MFYAENSGTNFYNTQIVYALQHLMAPTTVVNKEKNKRFRATATSAKSMLIKLVNGKTEMKKYLEYFTKWRESEKQDIHPIVFALGESHNTVIEFVVSFRGLSYFFDTIIEAIDAAFKCYLFFQIGFPPEHKRFWSVINGLFYNVECGLNTTPAISSTIGSFVAFKE